MVMALSGAGQIGKIRQITRGYQPYTRCNTTRSGKHDLNRRLPAVDATCRTRKLCNSLASSHPVLYFLSSGKQKQTPPQTGLAPLRQQALKTAVTRRRIINTAVAGASKQTERAISQHTGEGGGGIPTYKVLLGSTRAQPPLSISIPGRRPKGMV